MAVANLLTNLHLLGFDPPRHAPGSYAHLSFDDGLFTTSTDTHKAFEVISYFLFHQLDPTRTRTAFGKCWPVDLHRHSREYRAAAYKWLDELRLAGKFVGRVVLRRSMLEDCRGERMARLMVIFSTFVLQQVLDRSYWQANAQHIRLGSLPKSSDSLGHLQNKLEDAISTLSTRFQRQTRQFPSSSPETSLCKFSPSQATTQPRLSPPILSSTQQTLSRREIAIAGPTRSTERTETRNKMNRQKDPQSSLRATDSSVMKRTPVTRRRRWLASLLKEYPLQKTPAPEWTLPRLVPESSSPEALARIKKELLQSSTNLISDWEKNLDATLEISRGESSTKTSQTLSDDLQPQSPTPCRSIFLDQHSTRATAEPLPRRSSGQGFHGMSDQEAENPVSALANTNHTDSESKVAQDEVEKPAPESTKSSGNLWSDGLSPVETIRRPDESTTLLSSPLSKSPASRAVLGSRRAVPGQLSLRNTRDSLACHNPQQFKDFLRREDNCEFDWYDNVYTRSPSLKIPCNDADLDKYPESMRSGPFVTRYDPTSYRNKRR